MKPGVVAICLSVLFALQTNVLYAKDSQEYKAKADQYYVEKNFKKAYKYYFKLAKKGDHYSQGQVSKMVADGEGREVDLTEAYAWSVLAAEGGQEKFLESRDELLQQVDDKNLAHDKARDLKKKYGKDALAKNAERQANRNSNKSSSYCTGSRLPCR